MDGSQGGSNAPAPFLTKTYEMVDDSSTNSIVSWSPKNDSFIVWNMPEFARDLLPKYFKHSNFSSFVRQLNTYGFRKIDPDQWEFANDEFIRGQRHLLKNIHRRKPVHSHSLQNHGQGGLTETLRQELEDEIDKLRNEKMSLLSEMQRHKQERKDMELQVTCLEERLHLMERHQRQMMAFLAQIMQRPGFVPSLVHESENQNKKRRLPNDDNFYQEDTEHNSIVTFKPVLGERSDAPPMLMINTEPFEKLESCINSWEDFLYRVGQASGEEIYSVGGVSLQPSPLIITEMPASSEDTDISLHQHSPRVHSSSPHSKDIHSSPELAESSCYEETPVICSLQPNSEVLPKDLVIDVNSKPPPAAPEAISSKELEVGPTPSPVQAGANDVFWEQYLTETPGSSDTQEVQSERRDTSYKKSESNKPVDRGRFWWNTKNMDNLTEQMGQLTPVEKT